MKNHIFLSGHIFVDETPVDELAPGKGKTDQGYVFTVVGGQSLNHENRLYIYFPDRKHAHFNELLSSYTGVLHSDKYGAYAQLAQKKNPHEYFEDILRRYQSHPYSQLEELLPENWLKLRNN